MIPTQLPVPTSCRLGLPTKHPRTPHNCPALPVSNSRSTFSPGPCPSSSLACQLSDLLGFLILLPLLLLVPSPVSALPLLSLSLLPLPIRPPVLEFFREMLSISQHSLAQLFSHSYGRLYSQHAIIFNSLFSGLRDYYEKSGEGLEDTLADFWAQLLERAFPLLHPQYSFPPDFLLCLTRLTSTADGSLQPFGDSPRRLRLQVRGPTT